MRNRVTTMPVLLPLLFSLFLTGCSGKHSNQTGTGESGSIAAESGTTETKPGTTEAKPTDPDNVIVESFGPDENSIVWVVRFDDFLGSDESMIRSQRMKQAVDAVNQKLEEDGKDYRLKVVAVRQTDVETLKKCKADIVKIDGYKHDEKYAGQSALDAGLMAPLDEWLPGSRLYDSIAEIIWEMGWYRGSHYFIQDESALTYPLTLWANPACIPEGMEETFDGDLLSLEKYLSPEHPLYFAANQFRITDVIEGYMCDYVTRMVYRGDTCINPLEDEKVVELFRTLNRWYKEGKLVVFFQTSNPDDSERDQKLRLKSSFLIGSEYQTAVGYLPGEPWRTAYQWKAYACHLVTCPIGILAGSEKKAEAFSLLEQIYADREYAERLGMCASPAYYFGLAVGFDDKVSYSHFASIEERNRYYEENVVPSPSLYLDHPSNWRKLSQIESSYLGDGMKLISAEDFDATLEKFRNELNEPMEQAIREVMGSRQ